MVLTSFGFPEELEQKSTRSCPVYWTDEREVGILKHMETREAFRRRVRYEQQLAARLHLATTRLAEAEQERIWAIVAAHQAGLSIRQIAAATGLSRSRIHQLLQDAEAREIPTWLSLLRAHDRPDASEQDAAPPPAHARMQARGAAEVEVCRWCLDWLERLERGEPVVVNLHPDPEAARPEPAAAPRARHRQRRAEPEEEPQRGRTAKEPREA